MPKLSRMLKALGCALATGSLGACATPTLLTKTSALEAFKPIANSAHAPCRVQREIAEHNTVYDTLKTGKPVKYLAPCDADKPQEPKTS